MWKSRNLTSDEGMASVIGHTPERKDRRRLPVALLSQVVRYLGVAVVAAVVDTGLLWVLNQPLGVHYAVAAAAGFVAGLLTNFGLARRFVFGRTNLGFWAELSGYTTIGLGGVALTELILWLGIDVAGLYVLAAKAIALVVVFSWNFMARRYLIYRSEPTARGLDETAEPPQEPVA